MSDDRRGRGPRRGPLAHHPAGGRRPDPGGKRPAWAGHRQPAAWPETFCGCDDCKAACLNSPGWFLPGEIERLADYLNLTLEALFRKYLAVGITELPDGSKRHGVMPHKFRDHKRPGHVWTLAELAEPGRCVFYDHGKCEIYPVRPFECSRMIHSHRKELKLLRRWVVEQWTRAALQPFEAWTGQRLFPKHVPAGAEPQGRRAQWRQRHQARVAEDREVLDQPRRPAAHADDDEAGAPARRPRPRPRFRSRPRKKPAPESNSET